MIPVTGKCVTENQNSKNKYRLIIPADLKINFEFAGMLFAIEK